MARYGYRNPSAVSSKQALERLAKRLGKDYNIVVRVLESGHKYPEQEYSIHAYIGKTEIYASPKKYKGGVTPWGVTVYRGSKLSRDEEFPNDLLALGHFETEVAREHRASLRRNPSDLPYATRADLMSFKLAVKAAKEGDESAALWYLQIACRNVPRYADKNPRKRRNPASARLHNFLCRKSEHGRPDVIQRLATIESAADGKKEAAFLKRIYGYKTVEWVGPAYPEHFYRSNPAQRVREDASQELVYPKSRYPWGVSYKRKLKELDGLVVDGTLSFMSEKDAAKWASSPRVAKEGYFGTRVYKRNPAKRRRA